MKLAQVFADNVILDVRLVVVLETVLFVRMELKTQPINVEILVEPIVLSVKMMFVENVLKEQSQLVALAVLIVHLVPDPLMEFVFVQVDSFTIITVWPLALQDTLVLMVNVKLVLALVPHALALLTNV